MALLHHRCENILEENIEPILELLEEALRRLRQNGDPRIVFSYFALAASRYINFGK